MAIIIATGTGVDIASTYGASVNMTAITNATEAVATLAAGHGVVVGDFLEVTSGWQRLTGRIVRVKTVATNDVTLESINTSSTSLFPLAIHRLIGNLIDNAFAYGKGKVAVSTRITAGYIIISVMDNGPGIPDNQMNRLLRPFERMDSARGNEGGSGLGLAIADRIAKLHKGKLELLNRPEGGLEARLSLPL